MGNKMSNAPVYYSLAQVRFNSVTALEQYVPKIQDTFRKAGYPDFQKLVVATLALTKSSESQLPTFQQQARYHLLNESKTAGFIVEASSISFQTTDYETFEPFSAAFTKGLGILHDALELSYSERIGMRMLDAVVPKDGEKLSSYLTSSVLGLTDQLGQEGLVHSISETRTKRGKANLNSRSIIQRQDTAGVAFPEELHPVPIEVGAKFKGVTGLYGIIDTDSWVEERAKFDVGGLEKTLDSLHAEITLSFSHMVTEHAIAVWK
jgi:uncharacterized protein (TIGR04255 family)